MSAEKSLADQVQSLLRTDSPYDRDINREIHALGSGAIEPLISAVRDPELRTAALHALLAFGAEASDVVPEVIGLLSSANDFDDDVWAATQLLSTIGGPAIAALMERLVHCDEIEFERCRTVFSDMQADDVIPVLIEGLADADPRLRTRCCQVLSRVRYSSKFNSTAPLIRRLADPDESVRNAAIWPLLHLGNTQEIRQAYEDSTPLIRVGCLKVLAKSWSFREEEGLRFFLSALADKDPSVRIAAAEGLMTTATDLSTNAIGEDFQNEDPKVRIAAMQFCRQNSGSSHRLASKVKHLSHDKDVTVRRKAAAIMAENRWYRGFEIQRVRSILDEALHDIHDANRPQYLSALSHSDAFNRSLIPVVIACLRDPDRSVATAAAFALGRIGEDSQKAVEALISVLDLPDLEFRRAAIAGLRMIGPAAATALPQLRKLLQQPETMSEVLAALEGMGPAAEPALKDVVGIIGRRTEHAPYVLASIGTKEAILEIAKSIDSYGHGDRKDYESSCGALGCITESARPVLEAEFRSAKPRDYSWILAGLETILDQNELFPFVLTALMKGDDRGRFSVLHSLNSILKYHEDCLRLFVQNSDAVSRMAESLQSEFAPERLLVLEIFAAMHKETPVFTETYLDRLMKALRQNEQAATMDYEREKLHEVADPLGIPRENYST